MTNVKIKKCYGKVEYTIFDDETYIVHDLYVKMRYRRNGYAKKLLKMCFNRIRRTYPGLITIVASPGANTNITERKLKNFYHSLGFEVVAFY